jgi:hypothetical protein
VGGTVSIKSDGGGGDGGMIGSVVSGLRGVLGQYVGIMKGMLGGGKTWAETVQSTIQTGIGNFMKIFGGMALSGQAGVGNMLAQSLEVMTTVFKCKGLSNCGSL